MTHSLPKRLRKVLEAEVIYGQDLGSLLMDYQAPDYLEES